MCTPSVPDIDFLNTVHRLRPEDSEQVPLIAQYYRAAGVQPWLEVTPAPTFEGLAAELSAAGDRHVSFLAVHDRNLPAPPPDPLPGGVVVEEVGPDHEEFVQVLPQDHGVTEPRLTEAIRRSRPQSRVTGARRYLARVDGSPAAAALRITTGPG